MKRVMRWLGTALGVLVALAIVAYAVVYFLSERNLRRVYEIPAVAMSIPSDPASIAEGRRLTIIHGCSGCHGGQVEGTVMFDEPMVGRIVAPNLTAAAHKYSDSQLVNIIRNGVRPDGRSMMVMPSEAFAYLSDEDLGRIIAYLKSVPAVEGPGPSVSMGPLGRIGVAMGQFQPVAALIASTVPPPEATSDEAKYGRYLARTICAQCHGTNLHGDTNPEFTSPSLRVAAAYSLQSFTDLMRKGAAIGGRTLATMGPWAQQHLSLLTDPEIAALHSYLHTMP